MDKITLHIKSKEFIEELIKDNVEIEAVVKDSIVHKVAARLLNASFVGTDSSFIKNETIHDAIKKEIIDPTSRRLSNLFKDQIKEEIHKAISEEIKETILSMWEEAIKPVLDECIRDYKDKILLIDFDHLIKEEIRKQVKARLDKF